MTAFDLQQIDALLSTTRSVRRRLDLDRPVERSVVLDCLRIASQAPIGSNLEVRRWMVVTEPGLKADIARVYSEEAVPYLEGNFQRACESGDAGQERVFRSALFLAHNLHRVPVLVIPCVRPRIDLSSTVAAASAYGSISPAVWSFQLALRSRGLGSTLTTLHLGQEPAVGALLGIPENVGQVALLPVAYSLGLEFKPARRRPVEAITYWNEWENTDA